MDIIFQIAANPELWSPLGKSLGGFLVPGTDRGDGVSVPGPLRPEKFLRLPWTSSLTCAEAHVVLLYSFTFEAIPKKTTS